MQLTDPASVFLIIPAAAAIFYLCPQKMRSAALAVIGAVLLWFAEPFHSVWMVSSLLFDGLAVQAIGLKGKDAGITRLAFYTSFIKNLTLIAVFGVFLPFGFDIAAPQGLIVTHIASMALLLSRYRGEVPGPTAWQYFGYLLLPGHIVMGPVVDPKRLLPSLASPKCTPARVGEGVFYILTGVIKRVLLAEQLFALYKSLLRLSQGQLSVACAWLTALVPAMAFCFVFSAYSDIAMGLSRLFGIRVPRMTYYPFQARGARASVYHINMALEDTLGHMLFADFDREENSLRSLLVSMLMPILLAVLIGLDIGMLLWAFWLSAAVFTDWIIFRKTSPKGSWIRIVTLIGLLPAYALIGFIPGQSLTVLPAMFGIGDVPLVNNVLLYFLKSNFALLSVSVILCSSVVSIFMHRLRRSFPELWWMVSAIVCIPLLILTASFMIRLSV